ncbi:MAG: hypothetical protein IAE67_00440, partial [Candidatus Competibacteraceae bacterium]|nr:hypothetical protein [Candidatus Competibacteraceae bacterium]
MEFLVFVILICLFLSIILLFIKRSQHVFGSSFLIFLTLEFLYHLIMFLTSNWGIFNHTFANTYALISFPLLLYFLFRIYRCYHPERTSFTSVLAIFAVLHFAGWVLENFLFSNINSYNSYIVAADSMTVAFLSLYMLQHNIFSFPITQYRQSIIFILVSFFI